VFAWKNRSDIAHDRNWFPNVEYCLFYTLQEESFKQKIGTGLTKILMSERFSVLQDYFKIEKEKTGLNYKELDELMGVKASFSYWDKPTTHPYRIPKKQNYSLLQNTGYFQKPYQEVESLYLQIKKELDFEKRRLDEETWTEYIKERYTFNKSDNISCVWEFDESNSGKYHPTQKPISLIEKIIKASSNEGDIVLDCFMGSGTTAVAAVRTGRKFIGFEREPEYVEIANRRLDNETEAK
jgi:DNA modification methylase